MSAIEITAKAGKEDDSPSATVTYDMGDTLDDAVELFGADVVHKRFCAAVTIDIQALIRRGLNRTDKEGQPDPMTQDDLQAAVSEWKPGVSKQRKSGKEKALEALEKLSTEEREELLKQLSAA